MTENDVRLLIEDNGFEDVMIFSNPSYADAFIGVDSDSHAVYDYDRMIECLVREDNMTLEQAADFISFNASFMCDTEDCKYPRVVYVLNKQDII